MSEVRNNDDARVARENTESIGRAWLTPPTKRTLRDASCEEFGAFLMAVFGTAACPRRVGFLWLRRCGGVLETHDYGAECEACGHLLPWTPLRDVVAHAWRQRRGFATDDDVVETAWARLEA